MTQPRSQLVSLIDTPHYHITSRCVRRSFLCGRDEVTGENYEHRRQLIEDRIRLLSSLFTIDICAYAVMSNHLHLVVKLNPSEADNWSTEEVLERWTSLYKGAPLVQRYMNGEQLDKAERDAVSDRILIYKQRLQSISWFMKCLNEPIARQANREDKCTGHFWESRYKSQALLNEDALLSAMVYVDLNPIRAQMATTPEESDFTSIKSRINQTFDLAAAIQSQTKMEELKHFNLPLKPLAKFEGNLTSQEQLGILFDAKEYLELVDITGRIIRNDKKGSIKHNMPPILTRLNLDIKDWLLRTQHFEQEYQMLFAKKRRRKAA